MKIAVVASILLITGNAAFADLNGIYRSEYRNDKCGVLIFSENEIRYEYGTCDQTPVKVVSDVVHQDDRLVVDDATFDFRENSDGSLEGLWRLGGHFGWLTFHKIKG